MKYSHLSMAAAAVLAVTLGPIAAAEDAHGDAVSSGYRLVQQVPLGAPDRWDYVVYDRDAHRVYVAHGDRVTVVDGHSGSVLGQVRGMPGGTHGIAISHAANLGFTDDGEAGQGVAFDLGTLQVTKRLKADDDADAVTIDPMSGHVFIIDGDPGELTVIDPRSDSVIATVHAGSKLEYAVAGDNGKVYVNGVEKRVIYRIDTGSNQVDATWSIPDCEGPHGLAIDTATHRLFSSCVNQKLTIVNADSGAVVDSVPIGRGSDAAAFDPSHKLIFSSNGTDGTVTMIREVSADRFVPAGTLKTMLSARTMSVDPDSGRLFVVGAKTSAKAMAAWLAARRAGKRMPLPLTPGSLELRIYDPAQ